MSHRDDVHILAQWFPIEGRPCTPEHIARQYSAFALDLLGRRETAT